MPAEYLSFRKFLNSNKCTKQFDNAFYIQNGYTVLDEALWNNCEYKEYIFAVAFDWSKTLEGRSYWKAIDQKWYHSESICTSQYEIE